jgi:hypothetical protein
MKHMSLVWQSAQGVVTGWGIQYKLKEWTLSVCRCRLIEQLNFSSWWLKDITEERDRIYRNVLCDQRIFICWPIGLSWSCKFRQTNPFSLYMQINWTTKLFSRWLKGITEERDSIHCNALCEQWILICWPIGLPCSCIFRH